MLTLLSFARGGKVHSKREAVESIAKKIKRSDEGLKELSSEERPLFDNRVAWTRTYSLKAGRK